MSRLDYKASKKFFFLLSKINNPQIEVLQATKETNPGCLQHTAGILLRANQLQSK